MKECFLKEAEKTANDIKKNLNDGDICFAMLTDSHLSDTGDCTRENISAVDEKVGFDFCVHMGGIVNGNNPEKISMRLLQEDLEKYAKSIKSNKIYAICGEQDGYRNECFIGQLAMNIMTDKLWYDENEYLNGYENVSRVKDKPYYFADIPEKKVRMIFLAAYMTQIDEKVGLYEKTCVFDVEQIAWLHKSALDLEEGWTVLLFSNALPKSRFEVGHDPFVYNGYSTEQVLMIVQMAQKRSINIGCWFAGHYNCDAEAVVGGVNFAVIASQLPTVQTAVKCDGVRLLKNREIGTLNQDAWDAVVLKTDERQINLYRFGAGEDRIIKY